MQQKQHPPNRRSPSPSPKRPKTPLPHIIHKQLQWKKIRPPNKKQQKEKEETQNPEISMQASSTRPNTKQVFPQKKRSSFPPFTPVGHAMACKNMQTETKAQYHSSSTTGLASPVAHMFRYYQIIIRCDGKCRRVNIVSLSSSSEWARDQEEKLEGK